MSNSESENLKEWALANIGGIAETKSGEIDNFVETACLWLAEWCATKSRRKKTGTGYCAFMLDPDLVATPAVTPFKERQFFKEDHTPNLGGSVYITDYALNRVHQIVARCADLNEVIDLANQHNLMGRSAVVFDTDSQTVFVFSSGFKGKPKKFSLRVPLPTNFDCAEFVKLLDTVYVQSLRYPESLPAFWNDPNQYVPGRQIERTIQGYICEVLKYSMWGHQYSGQTPILIRERVNNAGRADLVILAGAECIIAGEIKVLRQRYFSNEKPSPRAVSAKFTLWWAKRGAYQAFRYKEVEQAKEGILILYDMRKKDADLIPVLELCKSKKIVHKRYYLHNKTPKE